jgi:hypothetical protein
VSTDLPTTTLCWACSHEYAIDLDVCPKCGATNGNADPQKALDELHDQAAEARRQMTRMRYRT